MAASVAAAVRPGFGNAIVPVIVYLAVLGTILALYVRGWHWLYSNRYIGRIAGGIVYVTLPGYNLYPRLVLILAVVIILLILRSQVRQVLARMPAGLRPLLVPLPFYLAYTLDWQTASGILGVAALIWLLYRPVSVLMSMLLRRLPPVIRAPLTRSWAVVVYAALITRSPANVALAVVIAFVVHHLDEWVETYFQVVWDFLRTLPGSLKRALFCIRLGVASSAPFVFAFSWGLFNPLIDGFPTFFIVVIAGMTYILMRDARSVAAAPR